LRDEVNPTRHEHIVAANQVEAELEKLQSKWISNGMARSVLVEKSKKWANDHFRQRNIPRRTVGTEDDGGRIMPRREKLDETSQMKQMLNCMQVVDQDLTVGEILAMKPKLMA
jgi:hypothetical protein